MSVDGEPAIPVSWAQRQGHPASLGGAPVHPVGRYGGEWGQLIHPAARAGIRRHPLRCAPVCNPTPLKARPMGGMATARRSPFARGFVLARFGIGRRITLHIGPAAVSGDVQSPVGGKTVFPCGLARAPTPLRTTRCGRFGERAVGYLYGIEYLERLGDRIALIPSGKFFGTGLA